VIDLEVYRQERLREVAGEAERLLAEADAAVASELDVARRAFESILAEARADGTAAAQRELDLARARGRRKAQEIVLAAQREVYDGLGDRARSAASALRADPGYDALLDRLEQLARQQLGNDARIQRDPPDLGGVVAEAHGQHVDYSLAALIDRSVRRLGQEVEGLWT
jgi:vacuolar-type H+-ATPase subunit E/Vma4